jgi:myo-inositol-1-phosphate synthase
MIFVFMVVPTLCQAGNKVGNGGNIISCRSAATMGTKMLLLDFYENNVKFEKSNKNFEILVEEQFDKLKSISPSLATQYLKRFEEVQNEIDFKSDAEFTSIPDSKHLFAPPAKDCKVVQTAIRKPKISGNEKRFLIRKDIWDSLDSMNKAGLITHEIIYEHLAKLGEEDSVKARKVNAYLYSQSITAEGFWKMMRELEIPLYP